MTGLKVIFSENFELFFRVKDAVTEEFQPGNWVVHGWLKPFLKTIP
jgi:hypothetical protein